MIFLAHLHPLLTENRFLLAKVQLDEVVRSRGHEKEALQELPCSPDEAYLKSLCRLEKQAEKTVKTAFQALSWILYSRRPLQMKELLAAVKTDSDKTSQEDADNIVEQCQGLVFHEKGTDVVRFVHGTVKFFLEKFINLRGKSGFGQYFLSNVELAKTCLTCLASNIFDGPCSDKQALDERLDRFKFGRYSAQFWSVHVKGDGEKCPEIQQAILDIFGPATKRKAILQIEKYVNSNWGDTGIPTRTKLIHVVAVNGLTTICMHILGGGKTGDDVYIPSCCLKLT
jgi:hypothetical protein